MSSVCFPESVRIMLPNFSGVIFFDFFGFCGNFLKYRFHINSEEEMNLKKKERQNHEAVIVCIVIAMFIAAFFYKYSHTSSEEQAAGKYMNAEQTQEIITGGEISYEIF